MAFTLLAIVPTLLLSQGDSTSIFYTQLNTSLSEARETMDHDALADAYYQLAQFEEQRLFDYEKSFEHYTNSFTYYKLVSDTVKMNAIQRKIAFRFKEASLYSDAIRIYDELIDYYQEAGDSTTVMTLYSDMSEVYKARGALEKQQSYLNKAYQLNKTIQDTVSQIYFLLEDVKRLIKFEALDSALNKSFEAFKLSTDVANGSYKAQSLYDIAYINKLQGDYNRSTKYFSSGLNIIKFKAFDKTRLNFYKELADSYYLMTNYEQAYDYNVKYSQLNDSILNQDRQVALNNANIRYQITVKNKDIQNLEKENSYVEDKNKQQRIALYVLMIGLGLLLLLLYYSVRFYTQKIRTENIISDQKEEINNQKIRVLEDKVKIKGMQSMIEGQELERERVAKDLHDSLGGLLSTIKLQFDSVKVKIKEVEHVKEYKKANKLLDTAVEEIRTISRNMQPAALSNLGLIPAITDMINRFDNESYPDIDFQFYNIPKRLDATIALSIYRVIQELLHNAIKHSKASEILIQLNRDGKELVLQFEDDGVGFDMASLPKRGMGLSNIKSRVNYLKGSVEIDSKPGQGTSYLIHVEY